MNRFPLIFCDWAASSYDFVYKWLSLNRGTLTIVFISLLRQILVFLPIYFHRLEIDIHEELLVLQLCAVWMCKSTNIWVPVAENRTALWRVLLAAIKLLSHCTSLPSSPHFPPAISYIPTWEQQSLTGQGKSLVSRIVCLIFESSWVPPKEVDIFLLYSHVVSNEKRRIIRNLIGSSGYIS